jgi:D-3-phosphoglycerate dehydrogenase / 2-oxoglutarate reductase
MQCLIVQPIHADGVALLRDAGVEPVLCPDADMATVARLIPGAAAAITRNAGLSGEAIRAAGALKVVVVHGTGYDHVDLVAATERRVLVCNTPGLNARSVAEMTLGLALAAARLIPAADRSERDGGRGFREAHAFVELHGKTALIVGWGATGALVGRMLSDGLGMRVLVWSPRVADLSGFERAASLSDGLARADLVSLHTTLRPETRRLIDAEALAATKRGAILVNTARGGLVDEAALAAAIADGRIRAAALDDYLAAAATGPLAASRRVIFTPHLGAATTEALQRVGVAAARAVLAALAGERPPTAVNAPEVVRR